MITKGDRNAKGLDGKLSAKLHYMSIMLCELDVKRIVVSLINRTSKRATPSATAKALTWFTIFMKQS
jgi:hypothetical protein